jgi:hypothetical protein
MSSGTSRYSNAFAVRDQAAEKTSLQSFAILMTVHPSVLARSSALRAGRVVELAVDIVVQQ